MCTNQGFKSFICSSLIYNRYLYYVLKNFTLHLQFKGRGGTFTEIPKRLVAEFEIPLPPLAEQRRIVARIEEITHRVEEVRKLQKEAIEKAHALLPAAIAEVMSRAEPEGWQWKRLGEVCRINPKKTEVKDLADDTEVTFVPMVCVDAGSGTIVEAGVRKLGQVRKGYTYFAEGDVLFAKITPCMENGKFAIARNLRNGIGFGTTEFHVLRPKDGLLSEWLYFWIKQKAFREEAATRMTGSAGQQRVPVGFLEEALIPLPALSEQQRIVAYLESVRAKAEDLKRQQQATQAELEEVIPSILSKAFRGEL
jgi:type I restriction enzyme S subunit